MIVDKHGVERDPKKLGGTPVFTGTRVPIQNLFDCLETGESLDQFLEQFPTVSREQAVAVLEESKFTALEAHHIVVSYEETFLLIGFADQKFDTQSYVTLQREYEYDEQDRALNMDTVYIERNDQGQSIYGGIEQLMLTSTAVYLTLSEKTAHALGCESDVSITITPTPTELQALRSGLHQFCFQKVPLIIDQSVDHMLVT